MSTKEEIEYSIAVVEDRIDRERRGDLADYGSERHYPTAVVILSRAYIAERAERQRRIEAAANAIEGKVVALLLGNGVDMRKHRIVIAKELIDIITRHLDGETT